MEMNLRRLIILSISLGLGAGLTSTPASTRETGEKAQPSPSPDSAMPVPASLSPVPAAGERPAALDLIRLKGDIKKALPTMTPAQGTSADARLSQTSPDGLAFLAAHPGLFEGMNVDQAQSTLTDFSKISREGLEFLEDHYEFLGTMDVKQSKKTFEYCSIISKVRFSEEAFGFLTNDFHYQDMSVLERLKALDHLLNILRKEEGLKFLAAFPGRFDDMDKTQTIDALDNFSKLSKDSLKFLASHPDLFKGIRLEKKIDSLALIVIFSTKALKQDTLEAAIRVIPTRLLDGMNATQKNSTLGYLARLSAEGLTFLEANHVIFDDMDAKQKVEAFTSFSKISKQRLAELTLNEHFFDGMNAGEKVNALLLATRP